MMKVTTQLAVIAALISTLSGCATQQYSAPAPAVPSSQTQPVGNLTDAEICQEVGRVQYAGDTNRLAELMAEGTRRDNAGQWSTSMDICKMLGDTAVRKAQIQDQNAAAQQQMAIAENAQRQAASEALMQQGLAIMNQGQVEQQQQQQQLQQQIQQQQQQMQMDQLNRNLGNINRTLGGW